MNFVKSSLDQLTVMQFLPNSFYLLEKPSAFRTGLDINLRTRLLMSFSKSSIVAQANLSDISASVLIAISNGTISQMTFVECS